MTTLRLPGTASAAVNFMSCSQQQDNTSVVPPAGSIVIGNRQSDLQPGTPATARQTKNPFVEGNEAAIAEGKKLYSHFNCSGCHAAGGDAIGLPLMDDEWIYGSSSANIFWTIIEGYPQGMPSFGGRIATDEVWQRAAYVRSLSDLGKETNNQKAEAT